MSEQVRATMTLDDLANMPALTDIGHVMALLGCSAVYACKLCATGKIQAVKLGKYWRVNTESLKAFAGLS